MTKGIEKMAEVRYYGLGILAHINNTKKGRVDDHFDINSVLFLFREPDIFLLTRYSPRKEVKIFSNIFWIMRIACRNDGNTFFL